jgi:hypothetical protein
MQGNEGVRVFGHLQIIGSDHRLYLPALHAQTWTILVLEKIRGHFMPFQFFLAGKPSQESVRVIEGVADTRRAKWRTIKSGELRIVGKATKELPRGPRCEIQPDG